MVTFDHTHGLEIWIKLFLVSVVCVVEAVGIRVSRKQILEPELQILALGRPPIPSLWLRNAVEFFEKLAPLRRE